jgi:DNA polymerase-1
MKTLLLIDANSLIHRAFHALPPLTAPGGRPAQALYGVSSILLKVWREGPPANVSGTWRAGKPDYAAALFDRPEPTFRKREFEAYKAQRPKAPDELVSQLIEAHELFPKFGIHVFEQAGLEADDLIASLAERFRREPDLAVIILTGDLDTLQLVGGNVVVRALKTGVSDTTTYDAAAVRERYGLEPEQLPDYKAFVGDASDNVKGVTGIGPKTAAALVTKYGTIEEIYRHLGDDPRVEAKLAGTEAQAELSKRLVTLRRDADLGVAGIDDLAVRDDRDELAAFFRDLGFESLVKRLDAPAAPPARAARKPAQGKIF